MYGIIKQDGCIGGLSVHHIKTRDLAEDDIPENLITLCQKHHDMAQAYISLSPNSRQFSLVSLDTPFYEVRVPVYRYWWVSTSALKIDIDENGIVVPTPETARYKMCGNAVDVHVSCGSATILSERNKWT